jgi:alkylhydroperoxidase family enzyme
MTWIRTIAPEEAEGPLRVVYDALIKQRGFVPNLHRAMSLCPQILRPLGMLITAVMQAPGALSRVQREMIAVVVSRLNRCEY